jgi:hypothetical protein
MKTVSDYIGKKLHLAQSANERARYELSCDNEVIGWFQMTGLFFFSAEAEGINKERVEFYKPHKWKSIFNIREAGKEQPFAVYRTHLLGNSGVLELPRGEKFKLKISYWRNAFHIRSISGTVLISFEHGLFISSGVDVLIEKKFDALEYCSWIILFAACIAIETKHRKIRLS